MADGREIAQQARRMAERMRRDAAETRSLVNRTLHMWGVILLGCLLMAAALGAMSRVIPEAVANAVALVPIVILTACLAALVHRVFRQAADSEDGVTRRWSPVFGAVLGMAVLGVVLLAAGASFENRILRGVGIASMAGAGVTFVVMLVAMGVHLFVEISRKHPEERRTVMKILLNPHQIFPLAAQERADERGPIGRLFGSAPTAEAWSAVVELAATYRDTLRASHEVAVPRYMATAVAPWGLLLVSAVFLIFTLATTLSLLTGWPAMKDPAWGEAGQGFAVTTLFTGGMVYSWLRDRRKLAALRRLARALRGGVASGKRAALAELDWLDAQRWGPAPAVILAPGRGERYVVHGELHGRPVLVAIAGRSGPRPRARLYEWAEIFDGPNHRLTNVFIAYPSDRERRLARDVTSAIRAAGWVPHVARDGVRFSRNDDDDAHVAPECLLPHIGRVCRADAFQQEEGV